jgi:hypothetical protein
MAAMASTGRGTRVALHKDGTIPLKAIHITFVYPSLRNWLARQWDSVGTLDGRPCRVALCGRHGRGARLREGNGEGLCYSDFSDGS